RVELGPAAPDGWPPAALATAAGTARPGHSAEGHLGAAARPEPVVATVGAGRAGRRLLHEHRQPLGRGPAVPRRYRRDERRLPGVPAGGSWHPAVVPVGVARG